MLDPRWYCENLLKIIDKEQRLVSLRFKPAQEILYEVIEEERAKGKGVRIVVLKGRQLGSSTLIEGLMFATSATHFNASTLVMAHEQDATGRLFEMNKRFYDELPDVVKPMRKNSNAKELVFENPTKDPRAKLRNPGLRSRIRCQTAGGKGSGRSFTFQNVHGSECAFWSDFTKTHVAVMAAVPKTPDSCVIYETTANGMNAFKDFWDDAAAGRNEWRAVFLPWYLDPDYRRPVPGKNSASLPPQGGEAEDIPRRAAAADFPPWDEYETEMMERLGLDEEQLAWRRYTIANDCAGDVDFFNQEYPTTPEMAFLTTGRPFFDNAKLALLAADAPEPVRVGVFEYAEAPDGKPVDIVWRDDPKGFLRLWAEPEAGVPYVLGADGAGDGTDRFTIHGVDNRDGAQVCEYENPVSEILFARQLYCIGKYFNDALIALEVNYGSYALLMLEQWGYPRLYQRQRYDEIRKGLVQAYGWQTSAKTRLPMLSNFRRVAAEAPECLRSRWLLTQMQRFQYDDDGKPQGVDGEHDDLVMAAGICHMARTQQRYDVPATPEAAPVKLIDTLRPRRKR